MSAERKLDVAFIGSSGVPNRYGGFESFLEHCGPAFAAETLTTTITCDARVHPDRKEDFHGVRRKFVDVPANGGWSVIHDLVAFFVVFRHASHIVVLGVSGAPWFPVFRMLCSMTGRKLLINVDGIEWRRSKFGFAKRLVLWAFDFLAQLCAHTIVYDNAGLCAYIWSPFRRKAVQIGYSGDHVQRLPVANRSRRSGLTICRIEPENQIEMLIEGALLSSLEEYVIVGNWTSSLYGTSLRERFKDQTRLRLVDPIYEPSRLAALREQCSVYLHGHSVGGTNPSLVEMIFYDCELHCFDVGFNRHTVGSAARFFSSRDELADCLSKPLGPSPARFQLRDLYTRRNIVNQYLDAMS